MKTNRIRWVENTCIRCVRQTPDRSFSGSNPKKIDGNKEAKDPRKTHTVRSAQKNEKISDSDDFDERWDYIPGRDFEDKSQAWKLMEETKYLGDLEQLISTKTSDRKDAGEENTDEESTGEDVSAVFDHSYGNDFSRVMQNPDFSLSTEYYAGDFAKDRWESCYDEEKRYRQPEKEEGLGPPPSKANEEKVRQEILEHIQTRDRSQIAGAKSGALKVECIHEVGTASKPIVDEPRNEPFKEHVPRSVSKVDVEMESLPGELHLKEKMHGSKVEIRDCEDIPIDEWKSEEEVYLEGLFYKTSGVNPFLFEDGRGSQRIECEIIEFDHYVDD